jgi:hypothetical protein
MEGLFMLCKCLLMNPFYVALDCLPSSVFSGGDEQVDMGRKLQEDPLYSIKKREIESRSQILRNPVKLKQLHELVRISLHVLPACMLLECHNNL